jgi:uncharacterized membrane protein
MTLGGHRVSRQFRLGLLVLAPILIVLVLVLFFPPDGNERAKWAQFIGRFHPLTVHFPIALFMLVPILELAGRNSRFSYLRLSAGFVLGLATIGAIVAATLGWCLARSGGYSGPILTQHMWGGISLAAVCWLCWMLRVSGDRPSRGIVYPIALMAGVVLVLWTGYRGGQLSEGEDHLTEYMPIRLRHFLGISAAHSPISSTGANTFYAARVEPIFTAHCVTCHGPQRHKANLRLDSYGSLMRGGKNGLVVRAGNVQASDLFRRITLSPDHDDFMPKNAKRPLSAGQVKLIGLWITAGASGTLPADAIKDLGSASPAVVTEVTFEEIDAVAVTKQRAQLAPELARLQAKFPNILEYESRGSADLFLNASILGSKFGDADLADLTPIAEHITVADLSRTAITDRSVAALASMKRLRVLRLTHTRITDSLVKGLGALDELESINIFDTQVTPAALPAIATLPKLAHCYVGQTAIPVGIPLPKDLTGKLVF